MISSKGRKKRLTYKETLKFSMKTLIRRMAISGVSRASDLEEAISCQNLSEPNPLEFLGDQERPLLLAAKFWVK